MSASARRQAFVRRRAVGAALALLTFLVIMVPLTYTTETPGDAVAIDGHFGDWVGLTIVPDAVLDPAANPNIDLVGVAAQSDSRNLYFYLQVPAGASFFASPGTTAVANAYYLLIDADRQVGTGFVAFGLGVDYMVVIRGSGGAVAASKLMAFSRAATDRTDASAFVDVSGTLQAFAGNELEGAVPWASLGLSPGSRPFLLALTQDSLGNKDLGDAVFSPGSAVLALAQTGEMAPWIPATGETLLYTLTGRAVGADMRLQSFDLAVESPNGGGVDITRAVLAGSAVAVAPSDEGGQGLHIALTGADANALADGAPATSLLLYGRGTGPSGSVVRLSVRGASGVEAAPAADGVAGHGSILPPLRYSYAYVGAPPSSVQVDGAFADWNMSVAPDLDPVGDLRKNLAAPSMGTANAISMGASGLDIIASRAEASASEGHVSFMLEVAGSIMSPSLLEPPSVPGPSSPSTGTPPPRPPTAPHMAAIYVDSDLDAATGWPAFAGMGVDTVIEIEGAGGGYGRSPWLGQTRISTWISGTGQFTSSPASLPVGFNSSALETQVSSAVLCGGPCAAVRYIFYLRDGNGHGDATNVRQGTTRGMGEALFFNEQATATKNVFQGDRDSPVLAFELTAPSTNQLPAVVGGVEAVVDGATPADVVRLSVFEDAAPFGTFDSYDLGVPPLGAAPLGDGGAATIRFSEPVEVPPGGTLRGFLTVDVSEGASAPSWFNVSVARQGKVMVAGAVRVLYSFPEEVSPVRILSEAPGSRGVNNLVLNEIYSALNTGWIEVYDTTGSATSLNTTTQISVRTYAYRADQMKEESWSYMDLWGSTNSSGFAAFDIPYMRTASGPRTLRVELRCNNCSAGGGNNSTYMDIAELQVGVVYWGRVPDGNGTWQNTTNNTRGLPNAEIPEFEDLVVPIVGTGLFMMAAAPRWRGPARRRRGRA